MEKTPKFTRTPFTGDRVCWGHKGYDLTAVRRVKKEIGWGNVKCRKENQGDTIVLYPAGSCTVCFISFHSHGSIF